MTEVEWFFLPGTTACIVRREITKAEELLVVLPKPIQF